MNVMIKKPLLILWYPRFTPRHPFFRFTHSSEITKQRMVKDLLGMDLPDDVNYDTEITQLVDDSNGAVLYLGTWDQFMSLATPKQIASVVECLEASYRQEPPKEVIPTPSGPLFLR